MQMSMGATDDDKMDKTQGLKYRLSQAKELRKDIEELRTRISDRVADEITSNITCAQQWESKWIMTFECGKFYYVKFVKVWDCLNY